MYCGYVAIIGRPNVGKSTLLNQLIGQKISITSRKPQTTRHRLLGIKTDKNIQTIYVDTPGLHQGGKRAINRYMNRAARYAMSDVDIIVCLLDALNWTDEDEWILKLLSTVERPVIIAINKVDTIQTKQTLLPHIEKLSEKLKNAEILPISAKLGDNLDRLEKIITEHLPENPHFFQDTEITDKNERFIVAEFLREKIFRLTGQELPYATSVQIEEFKEKPNITHISALIIVEREGQKKIILGKKGEKIKTIGRLARLDMEKFLGKKVFLQTWIKVRRDWSDDENALRSLGYTDS